MEERPSEINIVTLNCWGLKHIAKLRSERALEIGRHLAAADPPPHIVALQECFVQEDYRTIRRETRFVLPYGKYYHSGAFGGGLAILSRWPIEESTMFRYPLNSRPTAFWRGDWYVGKGVACAKIRYGPGPKDIIEVFNSHTHSPYEKNKPFDSYLCHRLAQFWELAKLLRGAAERGHLVVGLGDLNMDPMSLEYRLVTAHSPVRDVWRVLHPDSAHGPAHSPTERARRRPIPTAEFNLLENGATSDGPYNTWRWTKNQQKLLGPGKPPVTVPPDTVDIRGKRIDYILFYPGDIPSLAGGWVVKSTVVGMTSRHPTLGCSLSDHFSVEATLAFHPLPDPSLVSPPTQSSRTTTNPTPAPGTALGEPAATIVSAATTEKPEDALQNGTYLSSPTPSSIADSKSFDAQLLASVPPGGPNAPPGPAGIPSGGGDPLPASTYDDILTTIRRYAARERTQRRWRARHFFISLVVLIASLVGVWFVPENWIAFLLVLVSSLSLTAGTVDGLMALLFFGAEIRALAEFEWEIMNAKAAAGGGLIPETEAVGEEVERDTGW